MTRAGPALVVASLTWHSDAAGVAVYNLEVEGDHTYFVGTAGGGVWVHNLCFTEDQQALIELAKQAQRKGVAGVSGITRKEAQTLLDWAKELGIPGRGPEVHPDRAFGRFPHIHIGPINHIWIQP